MEECLRVKLLEIRDDLLVHRLESGVELGGRNLTLRNLNFSSKSSSYPGGWAGILSRPSKTLGGRVLFGGISSWAKDSADALHEKYLYDPSLHVCPPNHIQLALLVFKLLKGLISLGVVYAQGVHLEIPTHITKVRG